MADFRETPIAYLESVNNCRYYIFILVSTSSYVVCNVEVCSKNALKVCRFVEWGYLSGENRRTRIDRESQGLVVDYANNVTRFHRILVYLRNVHALNLTSVFHQAT